ncbi:MAG: SPOR domain-containing protein [Phaeodactylibacter sp.]|uniref:SPOR domain-containing protein n=1 Tax=Phaeodactylibacter sp. TaxID=1940289 RepID=UPI0032EC855A
MCTKTPPVEVIRHRKPFNTIQSLLLLTALLPSVCLFAATTTSEPHPFQFTESDYQEVQRIAKAEGKLFFLHFTADHVEQCVWMEKHTFSNQRLSAYINSNYLAAEVDIEKPEGAKLQHQFEINQLPTTLIFSTEGELIGGLTGKQTADEMIASLRNYDTPEYRIMPAKTKGGIARPVAYRAVKHKVSRPRLVPDVSPVAHQGYYPQQVERPKPAAAVTAHREQYPSIYNRPQKVQHSSLPQAFYSVQVGVFSSHQNAFKEKANLARYGTEGHLLPFKGSDGHTKYRLCAGTFNSKAEAEIYQKQVTPRYPDSFVKRVQK